ncbi:MAG: helix-turn-helix domain-containing protein, partial [Actinobacteria bacterium]|nr:helix-turn-helix domain-containing protein [Actinomycetota bacterium]
MKEDRGELRETTVGMILADVRRRRGLTVSDVERATKIRARFILAIEEDRFGAISGDVYARGFIKTYAEHLGLDPQPLIEQYTREYDHPLKFDGKIKTRQEQHMNGGWMRRVASTLAIIACMIGLLYWGAMASKKTMEQEMRAQNAVRPK